MTKTEGRHQGSGGGGAGRKEEVGGGSSLTDSDGEAGDGGRGGIKGKSLRIVKSGSVVIVVNVGDLMCL